MARQFDRFNKLYSIGKLFNKRFSKTEHHALSIIKKTFEKPSSCH